MDAQLLRTIESTRGATRVVGLRRTLGLLRGEGAETAQPPVGLNRLADPVRLVRTGLARARWLGCWRKLGLRDRVQAVVNAYASGLVRAGGR